LRRSLARIGAYWRETVISGPMPPLPWRKRNSNQTAQKVTIWTHHADRSKPIRFYCQVCAPAVVRAESGLPSNPVQRCPAKRPQSEQRAE